MKTARLLSLALSCALLAPSTFAAPAVAADWYAELTDLQQSSQQSEGGRVRATTVLRAALDASSKGLPTELPPAGANLDAAVAQAAYSTLAVLYPQSLDSLDARLAQSLSGVDDSAAAIAAGREWGKHVALVVLADQSDAVFLNPSTFAAAKAPDSSPPIPAAHAEQAPIGPGRYRFSLLAGAPGEWGHVDGIGSAARFDNPVSIAVDAAGNAYVAEESMCTIRKITPEGVVTTLAGMAGQSGSQDGVGAAARFSQPHGVAVDRAGNVYVADLQNHTVRKIDPSGLVTTLAGTAGQPGVSDGARGVARLTHPASVAVDDAGNVFVPEWRNRGGKIRMITPDGEVFTLPIAIPAHPFGATWASQLCVDPAGTLYAILDDGIDYSDVAKFTPSGYGDYNDSSILRPPFPGRYASGIGLDDAGNLYAKYERDPICVFTPVGRIELRYVAGSAGGYWCRAMTVDGSGKLFTLPTTISVGRAAIIEIGVFDAAATGPVITWQPENGSVEQGMSTGLSVSAAGDATLAYQWYFNSSPIAGATNPVLSLKNVQVDNAGSYSAVVTDGTGSVTSRSAKLVVRETPSPGITPPDIDPPAPGPGTPPATSGGGSFDAGIALALLGLLVAAARRGRGTFAIAAPSRHGRMEPS